MTEVGWPKEMDEYDDDEKDEAMGEKNENWNQKIQLSWFIKRPSVEKRNACLVTTERRILVHERLSKCAQFHSYIYRYIIIFDDQKY